MRQAIGEPSFVAHGMPWVPELSGYETTTATLLPSVTTEKPPPTLVRSPASSAAVSGNGTDPTLPVETSPYRMSAVALLVGLSPASTAVQSAT